MRDLPSKQETAADLAHGFIKNLLLMINAANEEAMSQTKQHRSKNGTQDGSLNNSNLSAL